MQRDRQLPTGANVQTEPFFADPPGYFAAQERLGGIVHVRPTSKGRGGFSAARAKVVLVDDEQRGPVLLGELRQWNSCDADHTDFIASSIARPHIRR